MKRLLFPLVLALAAAGPALANHCPKDMAAIDAKLATSPKLSDAEMTQVKALRAEGESLHKAGNHQESMKKLDEAKKILGI